MSAIAGPTVIIPITTARSPIVATLWDCFNTQMKNTKSKNTIFCSDYTFCWKKCENQRDRVRISEKWNFFIQLRLLQLNFLIQSVV